MSSAQYKIKELKNDKVNYHIKVTVPNNVIESEIDLELSKVAKDAKMSGFRPGKVPLPMLRKKYHDSLRADVVKNQIIKSMDSIKADKKLKIATEPAIEDIKNENAQDIEFTLKYDLLPEIKLPDFKSIAMEKPVLEVEDKDIEEGLKKITEMHITYDKPKKTAAAKEGDQVIINTTGFIDGKEFKEGNLTDFKLVIGSGQFIPGFEDQLVGSKANSDVNVKVTFPKDYLHKDFAGKPAEFKTHVKEVFSPTAPKMDDEFAKTLKCKDLKELKEKISEEMSRTYASQVYTDMKMKFFNKLEDLLKFEIPETLLSKEINALKHQTEHSGEEDEDIAKKSDKEKEAYYKKLATRRVRIGLMLAEYVKSKNIQITQNDLNEEILKQAKQFPAQASQIFEFYHKDARARETIKGTVLEEKAMHYLFANEVSITDKKYKKDKLEKLLSSDK